MRIRTRLTVVTLAAVTLGTVVSGPAAAVQVDRASLTSMGRYGRCDLVSIAGPDWFTGHKDRSWLVGMPGKALYLLDPAVVGHEPPPGPRAWTFIKGVCARQPEITR